MAGRPAAGESEAVDLLIVGGGVNGAGIARDAAGRGLSVVLCEKGDISEGTSSRSGKLIHGGLRYLEYYEFRLVREALIEREVLLGMAPHIIWPMRFVLPHDKGVRPAWMVRAGLFLYDHLGGRKRLPATRSIDLRSAPEGRSLRTEFERAFEFSDCWVDDARLVLFNAKSAAAAGAAILTRTALAKAWRQGPVWRAELEDRRTGETRHISARVLVNAAGPWVEQVLGRTSGVTSSKRVRLVKGSHIVVRKFWEGTQAYLVQNTDRRVIFINPYEGELALIGTTDIPFAGDADDPEADGGEVRYLCDAVNRYFRHQVAPEDVIHSFSGVRPLFEDEADDPSAVTRDYVFELDGGDDRPALLSIFGGKITAYRKLAEQALERLRPFFPAMGRAWTAGAALPGGGMPGGDFDAYRERFAGERPWVPAPLAHQYLRRYGTLAGDLLGPSRSIADLGRHFGATLYEREARYLMTEEWAEEPDDVLWRRTKHGLHMSPEERAAFTGWMRADAGSPRCEPPARASIHKPR